MSLMQAVDRMISSLEAFEERQSAVTEQLDRMESLLRGLEQGLEDCRAEICRLDETLETRLHAIETTMPDMKTILQNQEREERLRWRKEVKAAQAVTKLLESTY